MTHWTRLPTAIASSLGLIWVLACANDEGLSNLSEGSPDVAAAPVERPARTAVRVRVTKAQEGSVEQVCSVSGMVSAFRRVTVSAEVLGRLVKRQVEPGDEVEAGQVLALLDATRLRLAVEQASATLESRKIDLAEAVRNLERGDRLIDDDAISQSRHDSMRFSVQRAESALNLARVALRTARRNLADATVRAPFAGGIEEVHAAEGDHLAPGTPVATLVDLSRARVRAGVTAREAAHLAPGAIASIVFADLGGVAVEGEVRSIGRVADPATGTYPVELWVANADGRIRQGMVAQLELPLAGGQRWPLVPRAALIRRDGGTAVFVVDESAGEARAVMRQVRTGQSSQEQVEILDGVLVGEEVVVEGLFALRDGAPVAVEMAAQSSQSSGI